MLSEQVIHDVVGGARKTLGDKLSSVVLFGSVARGDAQPESDVDLALLVNRELTREERSEMLSFFSDLWMRTDLFFAPIDIEVGKFESWGHVLPLYQNIRREGIVLWNAA